MTTEVKTADPAHLSDQDRFRIELVEPGEPKLLRGAARRWPLIASGTVEGVAATLARFDAGRSAEVFIGDSAIKARYTYDESMTGFNFTRQTIPFGEALATILSTAGRPDHPTMYMGSLPAETYLPGIEPQVPLPFVPPGVRPRFWIGHASTVSCHYDVMDNVAVVAAGRRRTGQRRWPCRQGRGAASDDRRRRG